MLKLRASLAFALAAASVGAAACGSTSTDARATDVSPTSAPPSSGGTTSGSPSPGPADPNGPSDGSAPPTNCGLRTDRRGDTNRTITAGGLKRTFIVHLPASLDPKKPVPFVFAHHGYTGSGEEMRQVTGFEAVADRERFAVVFPDGQGGPSSSDAPWNVGKNVCPSLYGEPPVAEGDDFAFLDAIKNDVRADQCLDDAHVFLTGFSMGAYFAHHVGCMRSDIRAVAAHSGGTHDLADCPVARKPILILHGDADDVIPTGCSDPNATSSPSGVTPSATAWAHHNGCATTSTTVSVKNGTCTYYDGCPQGGQVALCVMKGMKHCWAGGTDDGWGNGCPGWESATELEWQFFKSHAW